MGVWLQGNLEGLASPIRSQRLGLVLLGHRSSENLEPLLCPPIPAVDGVIASRQCQTKGVTVPVAHLRNAVMEKELVMGGAPGPCADYEHLLWLRAGESLLVGNDIALLRQTAQRVSSVCLMPVHSPLRTPLPLTLLGLEPRWICAANPSTTSLGFVGIPIERDGTSPPEPPAPREDLAWVLLYRAIRALVTGDHRSGFALLDHVYRHTMERMPTIAALAVRNGLAAAIALGDRRLVEGQCERTPVFGAYRDIQLLQALIPSLEGDHQGTVDRLTRLIERDEKASPTHWISGGGETTYRALTLRGIAYQRTGALHKAVMDWAAAMRTNPSYLPPLQQLAEQRLHVSVLDELGLRSHLQGKSQAVQSLIGQSYGRSSHPSVFAEFAAEVPSLARVVKRLTQAPRGRGQKWPQSIRWEGPFFTMSSLGRVNRELGSRLLSGEWEFAAIPAEPSAYAPGTIEQERLLAEHLWRDVADPSITIRHSWPPFLRPVRSGKLVIYLPWEFGAIPLEWVEPLRQADELWVYSDWIRQGVIRSGVDPNRIRVIPCGVDPAIYHLGPASVETKPAHFHFLYVGGTIARKGYDLALNAFLQEFGPDEPVTLTVKDFGSDSFYQAMNGADVVRAAAAATADVPRQVTVVQRLLTDDELAVLYRSAHCLVAPYRAEGFCLPVLEGMACGTPAIVPDCGPAVDYTGQQTALLVKAETVAAGSEVDHMQLAGDALLCQVSMADLRRTMRWAFANRELMQTIGKRAAVDVAARFTWDHAANVVRQRVSTMLHDIPART